MSGVLAPPLAVDRPARLCIEPRTEDRWLFTRRADKRGAPILVVAVLSLALHVGVGMLLVTGGRSPAPPLQHEVSVDIVQDVPKPPVPAKAAAKADGPKLEAPKAITPEVQKPMAPPVLPKPQSAKVDPPKSDAPKVEPPKQTPPEQTPPKPSPDATRQLAQLQKELASLKAEHAALEAQTPAVPPSRGAGALAESFQGIALPGAGTTGDDVSYEQLVFSQLAKAKGLGPREGKPGTAGVRFEIDEAGALVSVEIAVPSGIPELDADALAIVRRAAPFPPPPKEAERQFSANVNFVPQAAP